MIPVLELTGAPQWFEDAFEEREYWSWEAWDYDESTDTGDDAFLVFASKGEAAIDAIRVKADEPDFYCGTLAWWIDRLRSRGEGFQFIALWDADGNEIKRWAVNR